MLRRLAPLLFIVAQPALASLYWENGVRGPRPTVCFAGDATISQPARVAQIKTYLQHFENAANIRFDYRDTCTKVKVLGFELYTEEIRLIIPDPAMGGYLDLF